MRFELYSLICQKCGARNAPDLKSCAGCGGPVRQIRRCASCQNENPPNAYVCLHCYRFLKTKPQTSFINFHVPWPVSVLVVFVSFGWFSFNCFKGWVNYVSAQMELRAQADLTLSCQRQAIQQRQAAAKEGRQEDGAEDI